MKQSFIDRSFSNPRKFSFQDPLNSLQPAVQSENDLKLKYDRNNEKNAINAYNDNLHTFNPKESPENHLKKAKKGPKNEDITDNKKNPDEKVNMLSFSQGGSSQIGRDEDGQNNQADGVPVPNDIDFVPKDNLNETREKLKRKESPLLQQSEKYPGSQSLRKRLL